MQVKQHNRESIAEGVIPSEPQGIAIDQQELYRKVDFAVFTLANLMNIIMVIIFLLRTAGA